MEGGKWDELPSDCLVNVFVRVDLEWMIENVPLVCKSWYKATLSPNCWEQLDFPNNLQKLARYSDSPSPIDIFLLSMEFSVPICQKSIFATNFLKLVLDRFGSYATMVKLSPTYSEEALTHLALKCPDLKKLTLFESSKLLERSMLPILSSVIGKFKKLESLEIYSHIGLVDALTEIEAHCENFVSLSLDSGGIFPLPISEGHVMSIVTCLPRIKRLAMTRVWISRESIINILKGCVVLVHLDVRDCLGFEQFDEEILKLASHIPTFLVSGCFALK